ncbi:ribokinase [Actinomadura rubrobrunea]|uniref:Ribokinase n=1 Tax=Actinomadura rubrobrunea TaxID=115335 RepID=A0A9W6PTN8_9ACTN|nr:carbohydrate kinase [Actinomadura rubrobrunea]GLW64319.1 ribokinase [Actinomadura rubrobrunea]
MRSRVTVVGEVLVDLLWRSGAEHVLPVPGGSPANVAVGLHRLERPVTLVTTWGDDPPGALIGAHLDAIGVEVRRAPSATDRSTLAIAYLDEDGSASYEFVAAWDPRALDVPADTAVLHTGSLALVVEPGASDVLRACRRVRERPGTAVAVDLNVRPAVQRDRAAYRAACERFAEVADVVKASDEDLAWLYPDATAEQAARDLLARGARLVVVTLGADGAFALTADAQARVPAPPVDVKDTVGAGDAFQAALLDALASAAAPASEEDRLPLPTTADELTRVLIRCVTAAAITCTRVGSDPPTAAELQSAQL